MVQKFAIFVTMEVIFERYLFIDIFSEVIFEKLKRAHRPTEFKKVNIPKHLNKSEKIQYRLKSKEEQYNKHALSKMKHHFAIADCDKAHTATQNAPMEVIFERYLFEVIFSEGK